MLHKPHLFIAFALFIGLIGNNTQPVQAQPARYSQAALRVLDRRVATIGLRLATANVELCAHRVWLNGFVPHDLSQYGVADRPAAIRAFGLDAGPAVLALADSGPSTAAGLLADDVIVRIDGRTPPAPILSNAPSFRSMEALLTMLDVAIEDGSVTLEIRREGAPQTITVQGVRGCATHFQVVPSSRLNALADGRYVQITTAIGDFAPSDDELAAVLSHEFAHNILGHKARLDRAGVQRGFLGNFGRNARQIRETEEEADRLSVYLLDRAGYDLDRVMDFWGRFSRAGLNFLGSSTHGSWRARLTAMHAEVTVIRRARSAGRVPVPPFLAMPVSE